jgi:hypothetical protein
MPISLIDEYLTHIEYLAELSSLMGLSDEYVSGMVDIIEVSDNKYNRVKELISILESN